MTGAITGATASGILGLLAAVTWGGGDFSGGMGVKAAGGSARGALRVIVTAHGVSLATLLMALWLQHGPVRGGAPALWGLAAGVAGGLSLTAFYIALARGEMGASAAVSGLLAAAIPAVVGSAIEGRPSLQKMVGFALAAVAIWMIAAPGADATGGAARTESRGILLLAICGGVGFGFYFVALRFANPLGVIEPVALARTGSLTTCLVMMVLLKTMGGATVERAAAKWLSRGAVLWALGVALLDTGGNELYLAATRAGRLDVAAVLASLYPASTILLAAAVLGEKPGRRQVGGMVAAAVAVVMITM